MFSSCDTKYLEEKYLLEIMNLAGKVKFSYVEDVNDENGKIIGQQQSILLSSNLAEGLFYEVLMCDIKKLNKKEIYILVGRKTEEGNHSRDFYVYAKGIILSYNACIAELCESLPALRNKLIKMYLEFIIRNRTDRKFLPELDSDWNERKIDKLGEAFYDNGLISKPLYEKMIKENENIQIPDDLVNQISL